ncbi:hypothetical protein OCEANICA350_12061 [Oceanicaulis sp. 350]|nr:hypothetical protein OCEANICA350_12061 [Oceanicaulis sp. 350]
MFCVILVHLKTSISFSEVIAIFLRLAWLSLDHEIAATQALKTAKFFSDRQTPDLL